MKKVTRTNSLRLALNDYVAQIWRYKAWMLPSLVLPGIGNVFIAYIPPLIIAAVITDFNGTIPSSLSDLTPYLLLLAGAWLFGETIWRIAFIVQSRASIRAIRSLYISALNALLARDIDFFNNNFAGSLTKRAVGYARNFESFHDTLVFSVFGSLIPLIFAMVILWGISPLLVLLLLSILLGTGVLLAPLIKRRQMLVHEREAASNVMVGHVSDVIGNAAAVQSFAHEQQEQARHTNLVDAYIQKLLRSWDFQTFRIDAPISPIYVLSNVGGLIIAISVSDSATTMAAVFVTFNYFINATRILFDFSRTYRNLENALTDAGQFNELITQPIGITDHEHAQPLAISKGAINFDGVQFSYPDTPDKLLFENLHLSISPGEKIALVGRSGGGKSTITKLLLRFADINGGSLRIDDQSIQDGTLHSLRSSIAYVPQDPAMFHRSITENIRYGNLEATDEQVTMAAKKAHALEFIEKLPNGFDTLVGERGVKLSGGQRQRIAIARAIIKDAPILILDEATSALDSESEVLIQKALWQLMKNRTTIVIAHRLSTIQRMDRIIVLDKGTIIEEGSHKDLLAQKGQYAKLWAHQSGGFIEE